MPLEETSPGRAADRRRRSCNRAWDSALLFAAIGVVVQLTDALNVMEADFARNYVLSFAAVLALGFLLLVSLLVTAGLAAAGKFSAPYMPVLYRQPAELRARTKRPPACGRTFAAHLAPKRSHQSLIEKLWPPSTEPVLFDLFDSGGHFCHRHQRSGDLVK